MATIIRKKERNFQPNPNKIDGFRLWTDTTRKTKGVAPQYLNFDLRRLDPHQCNAPYHFHRYAEELFLILSGSATLRTPSGFEIVQEGDLLFFEVGESGAHQICNHTEEPCFYLDMRSSIGYDVCEYPDSDKIILIPNGETFRKSEQHPYFEGETAVGKVWDKLKESEKR